MRCSADFKCLVFHAIWHSLANCLLIRTIIIVQKPTLVTHLLRSEIHFLILLKWEVPEQNTEVENDRFVKGIWDANSGSPGPEKGIPHGPAEYVGRNKAYATRRIFALTYDLEHFALFLISIFLWDSAFLFGHRLRNRRWTELHFTKTS